MIKVEDVCRVIVRSYLEKTPRRENADAVETRKIQRKVDLAGRRLLAVRAAERAGF